ncbi:hypothetical protein THOM_2042, partial [Trachipleistophora hominis]
VVGPSAQESTRWCERFIETLFKTYAVQFHLIKLSLL